AARMATEAGLAPVVVVTGDLHTEIENEMSGLPVAAIHHTGWRAGVGSSIRVGLAHAEALNPSLAALIILVCDQPYLNSEVLRSLVEKREESQKHIVACTYADTVGVPVIFDRSIFPH